MGSMTKRIKRSSRPYLPPAGPRAAALQRRGDTKVVFGATCVWWDTIDRASKRPFGDFELPCCPHCGSALFETTMSKWTADVFKQDAKEFGYAELIAWMRGKCFPDYKTAKAARDMEFRRVQTIDQDFLEVVWMRGFEAACVEAKGGVDVVQTMSRDVGCLLDEVQARAAALPPPPTADTGLDDGTLAPAFGVEFALGHLQAFAKRLDQEARERLLASAKRAIMGGE